MAARNPSGAKEQRRSAATAKYRRQHRIATIGEDLTAADVRDELREEAAYEGSQAALASLIGISKSHLGDILLGQREPAGKVLAYLGLERILIYRRLK
jgi:hypothetical protein